MDKDETETIKHSTNTKWIVWYHNPSDKKWDQESYKDIIEISYIEDFFVLKNSWNNCLPKTNEGMFFLMRKVGDKLIYPQWEDENNKNGGYWSFKIPKTDSDKVWFELMMFMIGECITKLEGDVMEINGVSISPKKNFCILKIWNKNSELNSNTILSDKLEFLRMDEALYSNHQSNIQKDSLKSTRPKTKQFRNRKKYTDYNSKDDKFHRFSN